MTFKEAVKTCHVRSAIYRESKPEIRYWKNHHKQLSERVPLEDQKAKDWEEMIQEIMMIVLFQVSMINWKIRRINEYTS